MVDRPPYPIPEIVNPEEYRCIVVPVPDEPTYLRVFAGVISDMTQWFNWARDEGKNGKECAQVWRDIYNEIDWSGDMAKCGCGCGAPPRFRFTADGGYQISIDGGITWNDAPEYDYRNNSILSPSLEDQGIINTKCQAADGVVVQYRDKIISDMDETGGAAAILALIGAVLLVFLTGGSALIIASMPGIGGAILSVGIAATQAAFTEDVWDRFRCLVFNRMDNDDSIDETGYKALIQDVHDEFEGIVNIVLTNLLNGTGTVGLTNMMRSSEGDHDANCDDCTCTMELVAPPGAPAAEHIEANTYRFTSFIDGGSHVVYVWFNNTTGIYNTGLCGKIIDQVIVSGAIDDIGGINLCESGTFVENGDPSINCCCQVFINSDVPFVVDLIGDCC